MDSPSDGGPRLILPRWRTLSQTPAEELRSTLSGKLIKNSNIDIKHELLRWKESPSISTAVELIEASIFSGKNLEATDAALFALRNRTNLTKSVTEAASYILNNNRQLPPSQIMISDDALRCSIRMIKRNRLDNPRDAVSIAEQARLHFLLGQRRAARRAMAHAAKVAPNNRYILRSAAQLFAVIGEPDHALAILWQSEAVRGDPWVQAAEVAISDALDITPRHGASMIARLTAPGRDDVKYSELAAGLASLEWKAGTKRSRIRKLLKRSLGRPNENALAQALWLQDETSINLDIQKAVDRVRNPNEALAKINYDKGNYKESKQCALKWFNDQPFSLDAARDFMFVSGVMLGDYKSSTEVGEIARRLHPRDHSVINANFFAYAMDGQREKAEDLLDLLGGFKSDDKVMPFFLAGLGLLAFQNGQVQEGRDYYIEAMNFAIKSNQKSLARNALYYWIEQEALVGSMTPEELESMIKKIDDDIKKLPSASIKEDTPTWTVRKNNIRSTYSQKSLIETGLLNHITSKRMVHYSFDPSRVPDHVKF